MSKKDPEYLVLFRRFAEDIDKGIYAYGEKLPSKRVIADNSGLSLVTVEHALELLADEGFITPKERSGNFVSYMPGQYPSPSELRRPDNVKAEPMRAEDLPGPAFPFKAWSRTVRQVLADRGIRIFERSPGKGHPELREELSRFLARSRGIVCSPDQIVVGSGSEFLYLRLIQLLGKDKTYAIEDPSYHMIARIYRAENIKLEMLKIGNDGILTEELNSASASVLHVTPYRSFPTGVTAQAGKRREYLEWASQKNRFVIEDDVESEFTLMSKSFDPLFALTEKENVIYMNSFSVTLTPALRIAYMVVPRGFVGKYESTAGSYSCPVPTFEQLVLAEFIRSGNFERYINRVRREKRASLRRNDQSTL